jgi:hypothetical protein
MRKLLVALGLMTAVVLGASAPTSAGGWVVISLDAAPTLRAGEPTRIGFTMLRHGVTPESEQPDGTPVQIVFTGSDGSRTTVDVEQSGAVGHHVATVTLPAAGTYTWEFVGPFMPVAEGRIEVPAGSGALEVDGGPSPIWPVVQWTSAVLAIGMALLAGSDLIRSRRRTAPA